MELKVGKYVITNDRMEIGKIKDLCTCEMCEKRGFYEPIIDNSNIVITIYDKEGGFRDYKFYDEPIGLIKPGDYVNGYEVVEVVKDFKVIVDKLELHTNDGNYYLKSFTNHQIKSIVTKEQFNSVKYGINKDE